MYTQRLASYSKNVIYYSLLVTPYKSIIVTHYFLTTVISYTTSYITFSSRPTEVVTVYLPHIICLKCRAGKVTFQMYFTTDDKIHALKM